MNVAEAPTTVIERVQAIDFDYFAQPKDVPQTCNLCGQNILGWQQLCTLERYGFPVQTWLCRRCGLVQISPRMTAEAYAEFYNSGTYRRLIEAASLKTLDRALLQQEQRNYSTLVLDVLDCELQKHRWHTALDVGGSTGVTAGMLLQRLELRYAVILDPASDELAAAEDLPKVHREHGTLESWDADNQFGIIVMLQTTDHLLDIAGGLQKIRRWLTDDGLFVVDIVNFPQLANQFGVDLATKIDHPFGLCDTTMRCYLARTGFDVVSTFHTSDNRHIIYGCRKVPPILDAIPGRVITAQLRLLLGYQDAV